VLWDEGLELLEEEECLALLASSQVGRVGVSIGSLPAIFPVNFALVDGAVVFRTSDGTKLAAATEHAVVAFEVDHVEPESRGGWSVLALGVASVVADPAQEAALREVTLDPWAGGGRDHYVRIPIEMVSGRRISPDPYFPED
jgi:nitroimidazol reductase NimA-like FMN-containing flavoprotein (pyridoxamine 5'-phosphate oxidase superfamily)